MPISNNEITKIAMLSRLHLSKAELEQAANQLQAILEYMALLNEVKTENVEPRSRVFDDNNRFRDDTVTVSLDQRTVLINAPLHDEEFFLVPQILNDKNSHE